MTNNHGLPYAQVFAYLPCTHARFLGAGLRLCCWDKGGNTNYPKHNICRKVTALNSYTVRRMKVKNGF